MDKIKKVEDLSLEQLKEALKVIISKEGFINIKDDDNVLVANLDNPMSPITNIFVLFPFLLSGDVDVITHECGHAFQGFVTRNDEIVEHNDIGMETAEIHSMSMEYFTEKYMEMFFGDRADDYRKMHLEDGCAFIPYGCMVDEFQHEVYDHPEMSPKERKEVWKKLEKIYKPHMDYDGLPFFEKGCFWQKQHQICHSIISIIALLQSAHCSLK